MRELIRVSEPAVLLGFDQPMEDPRDGLTLFGPLDKGKPYGIRAGVVGTSGGIQRFKRWVNTLQGPISNVPPRLARPPFPGFEAVFRIPWNPQPAIAIAVPENEIDAAVYLDDRHQRVYKTVEVFTSRIIRAI